MIKSILAALDSDSDASITARYVSDIAQRHGASITGLAVADPGQMETATVATDTRRLYRAEPRKEKIPDDIREAVRDTLSMFRTTATGDIDTKVEQSVLFPHLVEDTRYHDLLVVGHDPHFFFEQPKQRTKTLAHLVKETITPTLIVRGTYEPVQRVLITYDGSNASARALQRYAQLQPFGSDREVRVVTLYEEDEDEAQLMLHLVEDYLQKHDLEAEIHALQSSNPHEKIAAQAAQHEADLIVLGAHSTSAAQQLALGSTAASLLKQGSAALFVHH